LVNWKTAGDPPREAIQINKAVMKPKKCPPRGVQSCDREELGTTATPTREGKSANPPPTLLKKNAKRGHTQVPPRAKNPDSWGP